MRKTDKWNVKVYSDADWVGVNGDRKVATGCSSFVWGNFANGEAKISLCFVVISRSEKAEFRALVHDMCKEIILHHQYKKFVTIKLAAWASQRISFAIMTFLFFVI